jgi:hypothetical protein
LSPIDRLKRTLSFGHKKKEDLDRKKKETNTKKPVQWQDDEKSVRTGTSSFNVKVTRKKQISEYLIKNK